jgi:hypothetical protein
MLSIPPESDEENSTNPADEMQKLQSSDIICPTGSQRILAARIGWAHQTIIETFIQQRVIAGLDQGSSVATPFTIIGS